MAEVNVTVARSLDAVEALRPVWSGLAVTDIDADIDFYLTVVQAMSPPAQPHVVHIRKSDGRDLLVVARVETLRLPFKFGYWVLGHARVRALVVSFDGILGSKGRSDAELAISELRAAIRRGEADIVVMRNLDVGGDQVAAVESLVPWFARGHGQLPSRRWVADIPDSLEEFLLRRSPSTRNKLRREERGVLKRFGEALRLRRFERVDEMDQLCRDMTIVAAKSYQNRLGAAFTNSPIDRALLNVGLEKGWARVWMLYLGDRPVAFWPGTAYGNTFGVGTPGFDPDFTKESVGRFTMFRMIEDLCKDPAISIVDFGQGEALYKAQFGRPLRTEREIMLAAARPTPLVAVWLYSLFSLANGVAIKFVASNEWLGRVKTAWRKRGSAAVTNSEIVEQ